MAGIQVTAGSEVHRSGFIGWLFFGAGGKIALWSMIPDYIKWQKPIVLMLFNP
jgi:hypothetical protein